MAPGLAGLEILGLMVGVAVAGDMRQKYRSNEKQFFSLLDLDPD
jgi:hypothetical protein